MADGEAGKAVSLLFRIAALVLSVAAAVVMGTASQLVVGGGDRGAPSSYAVSCSQYNALKYFVVAGAISAVCSAAALYLCAVRAAAAIGSLPLVPLLDAAAQGLLFSAAGAAIAERGVVAGAAGPWGSSGVDVGGGGGSVCDAAGAFCGKVSVAAGVGACAAVAVAVAALARDARRRGSSGGSCDW
ncbi:hypothetical protein GQ55_8G243700 [Panicum hallii var. hallii]|uniref:CASP-like protein n=1 Tax=Panicum hallii var. hallii TaxID=1504633 RepID=A0A2T7CQT3_9POAL|nr:hypothetical protein GQ55_8G243700 [Panicum hallii var. hallii]